MKLIYFFIFIISVSILSACTTGHLDYVNAQGERKIACEFEFVGLPKVDQYALEYALSYCAKKLLEKGHTIEEQHLLFLDTSIPKAPKGKFWTHELAEKQHNDSLITDKEYGYIVAFIELELNTVEKQ